MQQLEGHNCLEWIYFKWIYFLKSLKGDENGYFERETMLDLFEAIKDWKWDVIVKQKWKRYGTQLNLTRAEYKETHSVWLV